MPPSPLHGAPRAQIAAMPQLTGVQRDMALAGIGKAMREIDRARPDGPPSAK